ncbi:MAG: Flap endonuclease Xni [Acidimicrobiales bacterium]|nr:MAG: flap endonuclease [Actinomycetota bacterium]MBV6507347.1 Flap endonuclease Xni [Acidimicrobiales bacterium]RIK04478.1 MAG: flap endonuclease [Acidobacteriota bacterium]
MQVHLVDGTYELFRQFYAPGGGHLNSEGVEVDATRRVLRSILTLVEDGATHVGVATDHVIESFRNDLYPGYKTGEGVDPQLKGQFTLLEDVLRAAGFTVWDMVEYEADDALAAAAAVAVADPLVDRVVICTPDKDLGQCLVDPKVVQYDRRAGEYRDAAGVVAKFGVEPGSIPDYLGLVGDNADGLPGLPGWGAKSASAVLYRYGHIEDIPLDSAEWDIPVRNAAKLARVLADQIREAVLYRRLATLETDVDVGTVEEWRWEGPTPALGECCDYIDAPDAARKAERLAAPLED